MTDERTAARALLDAVSADPPPTRLTVDGICAAARRSAGRRRFWPKVPWRLPRPALPSRRLLTWLAAVAAVTAVPALIVLAAMTHSNTTTSSSGGSAGGLANGAGGAAVSYPLAGVVAVSADGMTLSATTSAAVCPGTVVLRADEQAVGVFLTATLAAGPTPPVERCAAARRVADLVVRLARPLGTRAVLDTVTGLRLAVLDTAKLARATYLPPGYRSTGGCRLPSDPSLAATAQVYGAPARADAWCVDVYAGPGGASFGVAQVFGPPPPDAVRWRVTATRVHGISAQLRTAQLVGSTPGRIWYARQVRWTEHAVTIAVTSGPARSLDQLLPAAELLRIGAGLRP